jgi:RNA polymerase sigma factor (sigma-70 family)
MIESSRFSRRPRQAGDNEVVVAHQPLNGVFQRIRALAAVRADRQSGDMELLRRFVETADEAAFTVLVERHGPMVLGLCRRLLRQGHDAEDACQAAFLVLARRAGSLRKRESLASWLHGVAYRICVNLKRQQARRQRRERTATRPEASEGDAGDITWRELRTVLDEELQRLPQRYRAPLVLCYLEGKTRDEAAQELGAKPATLHGLLERGRKLLRQRLERRSVTLSAALFATALPGAAEAVLPASLTVASASAAVALARGHEGIIAAHILNLVKEASTAMLVTKLKIGAAIVVAAGMLTTLAGGSLHPVSQAQDAAPAQVKAADYRVTITKSAESDEQFIRRISRDLRGIDPTPAEIHFFTSSKEQKRRQKLIDLFIQERQTKEKAAAVKPADSGAWAYRLAVLDYYVTMAKPDVARFQNEFVQAVASAAKEKKELAGLTQRYLDQLLEYVKAHPKNQDIPEAMRQIALVYRSLGKTVEADAWRDKLRKEHPESPAAKRVRTNQTGDSFWFDVGFSDNRDGGITGSAELLDLYVRQALGVESSGLTVRVPVVTDAPKSKSEQK